MDLLSLIEALRQPGGVVLYPTETVYGLGGRADDAAAAERIARIKDRPLSPLIVLVERLPPNAGELANVLAEAFWPGPLTLVVPGWGGIASTVSAPDGSVAIRHSAHPVAQALVKAVGPITSTSANRSGQAPLLALEQGSALPGQVDAVYDAGTLARSVASTVVDARSGAVLREGAVSVAAIRGILDA